MKKEDIVTHLKALLDDRVQVAWKAMQAAQASANEESKSSAGDKYETGRAMAQNERDRLAQQYENLRMERLQLERKELEYPYDRVEFGALVHTDDELFFISISIGAIRMQEQKILVISPGSPVGSQLLGKQKDDTFVFKGKTCHIRSIE